MNNMENVLRNLDPESTNMIFAAIGAYLGIILVITLVLAILQIIAMWKIFTKAKEAGWKSLIPIYNLITYYKISGISPWLVLVVFALWILAIIPNPVLAIIAIIGAFIINVYQNHKLSKSFDKSFLFTLGLIFLSPIFQLILGLGNSQYIGAGGKN